MQFSLSFFASSGAEFEGSKYQLLIEATKFADENGFLAVWTPERHFHAFGGIFPNPSLMGVLLARSTKNIRIRAGSVVLPLHHPIRVAEEWSVVDNLSRGRVDLAFATGWSPNDFILAPDNHANRLPITFEAIETVKKLWRGEPYSGRNGFGEIVSVRIHPLPMQRDLPVWITCTGRTERFVQAGQKGFNVLTALIRQPMNQLAERIRNYRAARETSGHDPKMGWVTLMLHTFIGKRVDEVRKLVREPMKRYLRSSVELWQHDDHRLRRLQTRDEGLEFAFQRYFSANGLFGTVDTCAERVQKLQQIGVDEIACLVDYGVKPQEVLRSLNGLNDLRRLLDRG